MEGCLKCFDGGLPEIRTGRRSFTVFMELTSMTRCSWWVSSCCRSSIILAIFVIPTSEKRRGCLQEGTFCKFLHQKREEVVFKKQHFANYIKNNNWNAVSFRWKLSLLIRKQIKTERTTILPGSSIWKKSTKTWELLTFWIIVQIVPPNGKAMGHLAIYGPMKTESAGLWGTRFNSPKLRGHQISIHIQSWLYMFVYVWTKHCST